MTWVILTGRQNDLDHFATPHKIITNRDYLAHPGAVPRPAAEGHQPLQQLRLPEPRLLCLAAGQLARPPGHPDGRDDDRPVGAASSTSMRCRNWRWRSTSAARISAARFRRSVSIFFGIGPSKAWDRFAKLLFDWFRAPALEVTIRDSARMGDDPQDRLLAAGAHDRRREAALPDSLDTYTGREWRDTKARTPARYSFATLVDPHEQIAAVGDRSRCATGRRSPKRWASRSSRSPGRILARLANYDALFIRETTSISNHTYRFARRAQQEGMPVIDDPLSMIRCTNKVYLNELMTYNKVPMPPTVMIASTADLEVGGADARLSRWC